jgi:hypothetical protein
VGKTLLRSGPKSQGVTLGRQLRSRRPEDRLEYGSEPGQRARRAGIRERLATAQGLVDLCLDRAANLRGYGSNLLLVDPIGIGRGHARNGRLRKLDASSHFAFAELECGLITRVVPDDRCLIPLVLQLPDVLLVTRRPRQLDDDGRNIDQQEQQEERGDLDLQEGIGLHYLVERLGPT